jgi:2-hydroxychromene-2-carboxylate isomerase
MKRVELYFDYASPWAYLANELAARELPGVELDPHPIYLRGLETFAKGLPYSNAKLAYLMRDLERCAAHEGVKLAPPASFPIDGLHALRAALVAQERGAFDRFHGATFRAAWAEAREISTKEGAARLLAEALGATEAEALVAMAAQPIKDRLREATASAQARGAFGVPTFFVDEQMFWGHDRLAYVARAAGAT